MNKPHQLTHPKIQALASRKSKLYQSAHYTLIALNLGILTLAATIDALNPAWLIDYYPKTTLLLLSLLLATLAKHLNLEKKWYAARSLSESIKTLIWRFTMRTTPFNDSNTNNLIERIEEVCHESNTLIGSNLFQLDKQDPAFTDSNLGNIGFTEKLSMYSEKRIKNQLQWYRKKSNDNTLTSKIFFSLFFICTFFAITLSAWQETNHDPQLPSTAILIAISTALIGWIEAKKYNELAAAYLLTEHEISLLLSNIHNLNNHNEFSEFVEEAESLFSREHTQWVAKRGHLRMSSLRITD